jgi:ApbE superfamily uncharacterized protein (UPF0280 family)
LSAPHHARFPDGRLHLQHGPIDCIVEAWGERVEVEAAYAQAVQRFETVLPGLVAELPQLRTAVGAPYPPVQGPVAKRMVAAVWPHGTVFITPMAAVAGAVADELLAALATGRRLDKAYVNDGGDIALHLLEGQHFEIGIADDPGALVLAGGIRIRHGDAVRGVATSGWRGRSQSRGIADAVTILARTAAEADAAATIVANAVNVEHPAIRRLPARAVKEDSDLGDLLVTVEVGALPAAAVEEALDAGLSVALDLRVNGLIAAAFLSLAGKWRTVRTSAPEPLAQC